MWRVVLADDHRLVRQGVRSMLESETDFDIVGEAENGPEAVALTRELQPDILITDVMMPGLNGLEVARALTETSPGTRIIMLSMMTDAVYVEGAWDAGAQGYVAKDSTIEELVEAVRTVGSGRRFMSSKLNGAADRSD